MGVGLGDGFASVGDFGWAGRRRLVLEDHFAKTQDTLMDAMENVEFTDINLAVCRALAIWRASTIKGLDTIDINDDSDAHLYRVVPLRRSAHVRSRWISTLVCMGIAC